MVVRYGRTCPPGFLPVFSVDTEEEAAALLRIACRTDAAGQFVASELEAGQSIENLAAFSHRLAGAYPAAKKVLKLRSKRRKR